MKCDFIIEGRTVYVLLVNCNCFRSTNYNYHNILIYNILIFIILTNRLIYLIS